MNDIEKSIKEVMEIYTSNEYLDNEDKLFELEAKCNWLNTRLLEIKNSAKIKKLMNRK